MSFAPRMPAHRALMRPKIKHLAHCFILSLECRLRLQVNGRSQRRVSMSAKVIHALPPVFQLIVHVNTGASLEKVRSRDDVLSFAYRDCVRCSRGSHSLHEEQPGVCQVGIEMSCCQPADARVGPSNEPRCAELLSLFIWMPRFASMKTIKGRFSFGRFHNGKTVCPIIAKAGQHTMR